MRAQEIIEATGEADFPCIRFYESGVGYRYGDLYERSGPWDRWSVGDRQR